MNYRLQFLLVFFILTSSATVAQEFNQEELKSIIESKMRPGAPGIATGIVYKGEVVFEHYTGLANLEHNIAIDNKSLFNIASVAKQFTAAMVVDLSLQRKISLKDDLRKYLPELYPAIKDPITIEQLLTHTSGVRDVYDLMSIQRNPWWRREGLDNNDVIELLQKQETLNFTPGSDYEYSNSGYILLTAIIAKVTGQDFVDYSSKWFEALGMNNTRFSDNYMAVLPSKAFPYSDWGNGVWQAYPMITDLNGDGFLYTTLNDMLLYENMVHQSVQRSENSWLTASQQALDLSPTGYSYGLEHAVFRQNNMIYHAGGTGSYSAHMLRLPKEELSVFVMSNGIVDASSLANQLLEQVYGPDQDQTPLASMPANIGPKIKETDLLGSYLLESNTIVDIVKRNDTLYREIKGATPVALENFKGNIYKYTNGSSLVMAFVPSMVKEGKYNFELYHPEIAVRVAKWQPPVVIDPLKLKQFEGNYINNELDAQFLLSYLSEDRFTVKLKNRELEANLSAKNTIQVNGGYIIKPQFNKDGAITGFLLSYNRVKNILFKKAPKS